MKLILSALLMLLPVSSFAAESFFGVGAALKQTEGKTFIEQVIAGGPLERNGTIKAGDEIVSVQTIEGRELPWVSVTGMPLEEVIGMIRGEEGTRVGLHMVNATGQFEVFLTREKIDLP